MSKVPFKPGTMVYPVPAVMVSCGDSPEKYNIITIAWTGTINSTPPMTYVSVRKERHSHKLISEAQSFVINLTTEDLVKTTDYCGVKSGREVNKFAHLGLTAVAADKVAAPMIEESPVSIECRVTQVIELGSHDMFMAEVVAIHVDENLIDKNGKLHLEWSKPIVYSHGEYYGIGEALGQFGHSVMKKKTIAKVEKIKAVEQRVTEKTKLRAEKAAKKEQARIDWETNQKDWYQDKSKKVRLKEEHKAEGKQYERPYIRPEEWERSPLNPKNKPQSDRSYTPRTQGDRPARPQGDRPQGSRPQGDRPARPQGDRPQGSRPQGDRPARPQGARPQSDRPQGSKPQGAKPYNAKPHGTRPSNLKNKSDKRG